MDKRDQPAGTPEPILPKLPGKPLLLWHTLRYLRLVQWRYRVKNALLNQYQRRCTGRVRKTLLRRLPASIACRAGAAPVAWFHKEYDGAHGFFRTEEIVHGRFTFLNASKQFEGAIHWRNPEMSYLWDFNLHYFEYLEPLAAMAGGAAKQRVHELLGGWIAGNPCPVQPAWHPYPTSLRTINWIKLFVNHPEFAGEVVLRSLYAQLLFLEGNLEGHLQVNHLLENGRALLFGGLFFEGRDAERWYKTGWRLLEQEVKEEYLPNGGHFERSPMYHCILLEALLDTYSFLEAADRHTGWLKEPLHKMCAWLEAIQTPDGWFPLFNDAGIGVSASPDEILANAERMTGYQRSRSKESVRDCDKYFVLEAAPFFCVVDGAPIGPSYNPGHAHADNLTYELFLRGERVVVDVGTFGYDVTPQRVASRSTAAHNTVLINGVEQSEAWGGFRVARRSNPTLSRAGRVGECLVFQGKYENKVDPAQGITHERIVVLKDAQWMLVWDTVTARRHIEAESFCRIAPGFEVREIPGGHAIFRSGAPVIHLYPIQTTGGGLRASDYAPEFGRLLPAQQVVLRATGQRRVEFGYLLSLAALPSGAHLAVDRDADNMVISLNGVETRLALQELAH